MANTNTLQVMTWANLQKYDGLIKTYVDSACAVVDAKSIKTVALVNGKLCFYDVVEPVGATTPKYSIELPKQDLSNLMEKLPSNTVEGNIVVAGANGTVKDSGVAIGDLAKKTEVNQAVAAVQADVDAIKDDYLKAADKTALETKIKTNTDAISVLNGTGAGSVAKQVADAVAGIVGGAPEAYDTLKEISDWIEAHPESVAALNSAIKANADAIDALEALVGELPEDATADDMVGYIGEVKTALENKIATTKSEAVTAATTAAATDATTKANKALSDAKTYTDAEVAKDRGRLDAAEADIAAIEESLAAGGETANAIAAVKSAADAAQTTANTANAAAQTNKTDIANLTTRVAKNETDIAGLQKDIAATNSNVTAVGDRVTAVEGDIEDIQEKVTLLENSKYDDTAVKADIAKNAAAIEDLKDKDTELAGKISANEANIASVSDRMTSAEGTIKTLSADNTTNKSDIANLKTTTGTHTTDIASLKERTTAVEGKVSTLETKMTAVEKKASDNATSIASVKTTVSSNTDRIAALEANPVVEAITDASIESLFDQA